MKKFFTLLFVILCLVSFKTLTFATPTPIASHVFVPGDGLNSRWVDASYGTHNVDQALGVLALGPGDVGYVGEVNMVIPFIDFADFDYPGFAPGYVNDPLSPDEDFAERFYGYINITQDDTYYFNAYTDDGFRLTIGNEIICEHYTDRSTDNTIGAVTLTRGLYTFDFIGWEQGGAFVNELTWNQGSPDNWSLVTSDVLFTHIPNTSSVPEPATCLLFLFGIIGFTGIKKKLI